MLVTCKQFIDYRIGKLRSYVYSWRKADIKYGNVLISYVTGRKIVKRYRHYLPLCWIFDKVEFQNKIELTSHGSVTQITLPIKLLKNLNLSKRHTITNKQTIAQCILITLLFIKSFTFCYFFCVSTITATITNHNTTLRLLSRLKTKLFAEFFKTWSCASIQIVWRR